MGMKNELCRASSGLFVRNLGWKVTPTGSYAQHQFYLGREESKAKLANLRLSSFGSKDVLSERAQQRHGFAVQTLPTSPRASYEARYSKPHGQQDYDAFEERLADNAITPPPDAAAFRVDFPRWRSARDERDRRLIDLLILDTSTQDAARNLGVSPGRISQKRREFADDWLWFHGEEIAATQ